MSLRDEAESLDIRHFKLVTGDEIVALLSKVEGSSYITEVPLLLVQVNDGNAYSFQFKEWFPLSDANYVRFNKGHVIASQPTDLNTKEQYLKTVINIAIGDSEFNDGEPDVQVPDVDPLKNTTLH